MSDIHPGKFLRAAVEEDRQQEPKRRSTYIAPEADTYDNWLRTNHFEEWASLRPEAQERYDAHMAALARMRPDGDDESKYGRGYSA